MATKKPADKQSARSSKAERTAVSGKDGGSTPPAPSGEGEVSKTLGIGKGTPGPGRPPGLPNKTTALAREAIARFIDGNADRLQGWLDEIAADEKLGPKAAFECFKDLLEYHVPKLARTEFVGEGGGPVRIIASSDDENL
jgi:hypothetical protein